MERIYLGRQPIFDRKKRTVAYELLYRSGRGKNAFPDIDGDRATTQVLYNLLYGMGVQEVTGGRQAFVNMTRGLLLSGIAKNLDPASVVIEVLENVTIDDQVVRSCEELRELGFRLALDDFVVQEGVERLLPLASVVKLDFMADSRERLKEVVSMLEKYEVELLAEKIETEEDFQDAFVMGCVYFQGYFFAKPVILERNELPAAAWSHLKIMGAIQRPEMEVDEMTEIIASDPGLTYKLLQLVNSAAFGFEKKVSSIQQALVLLGEKELRRWLTFVILNSIRGDRPQEIMVLACTRGRFAELLACAIGREHLAPVLFLTGLLSMLGVIMGRPLKELLSELPLDKTIAQALLERKGPLAPYYYLVYSYERGQMDVVARLAEALGIDEETVGKCYIEAVRWTDSFLLHGV